MKNFLLLMLSLLLTCCKKQPPSPLYLSPSFNVFSDSVVQGNHRAIAISRTKIVSTYQSPASRQFSRLIVFKFSINQKDNEAPIGKDHWIVIGENEHASPLLVFGQPNDTPPPSVEVFLPTDYEYTFTVDMRPVLEQFEQKGYYEAYDGTRITKEEFKGVYIAGNAEPLTWDFANLENRGLKLNPTKEPFIYSITVRLNPHNPADDAEKTWQLSTDLSAKPSYQSDQPLVDALFNLSLEEAIKNIEPDSTFRTGAKWAGVWTRDISYSIFLAFAFHEPEVAKISLMKKVHRQRIVQDTGSGGAYPVSSDRMIWAIAAFEIFKTTGDTTWLKNAFEIIKNSAEDDFQVLYDTTTGLFRGESSFLDWREQTYPKWMDNKDIYVSLNLGTNVIHYQTYVVLAEMARLLGEPYEHYQTTAQKIKENINRWLWQREKGYYGQYLYGRAYLNLSPRFEALGEALAILFDVADEEKANAIIAQSPITPFGVTCIYPQIPSIPPYHNNAIWPFVQSYWNLAAAKVGNEKVLTHGLAAIYRPAALFLSNYENMVATNGDFRGTEINSERMLWSIAGNLAMVHRLFIGMNFELDGIRFQPIVPKAYDGTRKLTNFKYRKATLDITVKGFGNRIKTFEIDGENQEKPFFPATLSGKHSIVIEMNNAPFEEKGMNLVENSFSLPYPLVELKGNYLKWREVKDAKKYLVYRNGQLLTTTRQHVFEASPKETAEYKVFTVDERDIPSFSSEPIWVVPEGNTREIPLENFAPPSSLPYKNYTGNGFVEISRTQNRSLVFNVQVPMAGRYWLDVRYANGSGAWNTDNKCAMRHLTCNGKNIGTLVFPQRGENEWSDWGFSNGYFVDLNKGKNVLTISFEAWNENMNVETNRAMLDMVRVIFVR